MKKLTSLILALMLCLSMLACSSSVPTDVDTGANTDTEAAQQNSSTQDSGASSNANAPAGEGKPSANTTSGTENGQDTDSGTTPYNLVETVIADNEYCTFTVTGIEPDSMWGFTVKVLCENKTADKTLMFSWEEVSVNGYMLDPFWAAEVAAGKKANEEISFSTQTLKDYGINTVDEITFTLRASDSNDWSADAYALESSAIYPTGLTADAVIYPERSSTTTEQVIIDSEKCEFVILETYDDEIWGYTLRCYIENSTDKTLMFSWNDVSVNGYMIDPFWAMSVAPGKRAYGQINFLPGDFEANNITEVSDIEFRLTVSDANNWFSDPMVDEVLSYTP